MKLLACAIMVKNEEERIIRTLSTIIKHVDHVVVLDTGSTDNTIQKIKDYCKEKKKPLKLEIVDFVDFSYNRNILLKMCYGLSEFVLLLDANDEVKNPKTLVKFLKKAVNDRRSCVFNCRYEWANDNGMRGNDKTYHKIGIIRNDIDEIYYELPVHEFITCSNPGKYMSDNTLETSNFYIYQDRLKDKSSVPRIKRDVDVLLDHINKYGESVRALRYLCQSYDVLTDYLNLYKYTDRLIKKIGDVDHYVEDLYQAYIWRGRAGFQTGDEDFHKNYILAYKHALKIYDNAEPFYELAKCYSDQGEWNLGFIYSKKCCNIPEPKKNMRGAIVNYELYTKMRWILHNNIAKKVGNTEEIELSNKKLQEAGLTMVDNKGDISLADLPEKARLAILEMRKRNNINIGKTNIPTQQELKERSKGKKLDLLVSYRDRESQLQEFIPYMCKYLAFLGIDFHIWIVEQVDDTSFNRGILYNIAVKYLEKDNHYLCFHDVDILPTKGTNYYKPDEDAVTHLYGYSGSLGGIFLMNTNDYLKINGFSNKFEGWGYEDNEIMRRVKLGGMNVDNKFFYKRYDKNCFKELDSNKAEPLRKMKLEQTSKNKQLFESDIDYTKDGYEQIENYIDHVAIVNNGLWSMVKCNVEAIRKSNFASQISRNNIV